MIKFILWDFDGVIVDSLNVKTEAFYEMYLPYGKEIANKVVEDHLANGGISRFVKFKKYHDRFLNIQINELEIEKLSSQFSKLALDKVINAPEIPGVLDFIKSTQNKLTHYIISGTPQEEMHSIVERKEIRHLFKKVMGSPKTKIDWIKEVTQMDNIDPRETVFIGDALVDYEAAKYHNIKFILRSADYNFELFKEYSGCKVSNFLNFNHIFEKLSEDL